MKQHALLIALASALALGAVTTSFAQERTQNGYYDNGYGYSQTAPPSGGTSRWLPYSSGYAPVSAIQDGVCIGGDTCDLGPVVNRTDEDRCNEHAPRQRPA